MARNRKSQPTAVRFAPVLKAFLICLFIGGSGMGYVWQKNQIYELGQQVKKSELRLETLQRQNNELGRHLAFLRSPRELDSRVKKWNLGLVPTQPEQVLRLVETPPMVISGSPHQLYVGR